MKNMLFKALLITLAAALPWQANAGDQAPADSIRAKIAAAIPQLPIEEVVASPIEGLFEVKLASGGRLFVTPDGEYFVFGDMFKVEGAQVVNLTELQRNEQRLPLHDMPALFLIIVSLICSEWFYRRRWGLA